MANSRGRNMSEQILTNENMVQQVGVKYCVQKNGQTSTAQAEFEKADPSSYLLTYLLTHSMVQSPSWTANWFAASQEIPRISQNPKVHYRTHKPPPSLSILSQPNPVHTPTSHLLEIRPNIIHPSTPWSPQWSLSLRFPHQDPIHPPLLTHTRHMPIPSHSSCWLSKNTKTHSEYVTLFAFPLQQWFYGRFSLWRNS